MQRDYRNHALFRDARERTAAWLRPGDNEASDLMHIDASPDGRHVAATAVVCAELEGAPSTRIARIDLASGRVDIVSRGPRSDSAPKWSPDGGTIAISCWSAWNAASLVSSARPAAMPVSPGFDASWSSCAAGRPSTALYCAPGNVSQAEAARREARASGARELQ
jgi:hypothetical protein